MVHISRDVDYAVRSLVFIARELKENKNILISVDDIVEEQDLPRALLRRILQIMAKSGILQSHKGKGGGFTLIKDPKTLTVRHVLNIFLNTTYKDKCVVRNKPCPLIKTCKLRKSIFRINELVYEKMGRITIASLL